MRAPLTTEILIVQIGKYVESTEVKRSSISRLTSEPSSSSQSSSSMTALSSNSSSSSSLCIRILSTCTRCALQNASFCRTYLVQLQERQFQKTIDNFWGRPCSRLLQSSILHFQSSSYIRQGREVDEMLLNSSTKLHTDIWPSFYCEMMSKAVVTMISLHFSWHKR